MRNVTPIERAINLVEEDAARLEAEIAQLPSNERRFILDLMEGLSATNADAAHSADKFGVSFERCKELTLWAIEKHRKHTLHGFGVQA